MLGGVAIYFASTAVVVWAGPHDLRMLGLVAGGLRDGRMRLVIVTAAVVALLTLHWPSGTGILAAVAAGTVAGAAGEGRS